ncbi:hypothetical protein NQ810_14700, partial [Acinetobacter baumannii]|nr:hypothetical protein [Acinetobacter baumannii]
MALTPETFRDLETDIKDIGESGNLDKIIYPRYGAPYNSVPRAIRLMMETGGWKAYTTEAILLATTPEVNPSVGYAFDTKKLYLWNGTSWIDEGLSQLDQAKDYINKNLLLLLNSILGLNNSIQITDKAVSDLSENQLQIKQENKDLSVGLQCLAESINFLTKTDDVELDDLL